MLCGHIDLGMTRLMDLSERIGRRLKLQDLHVLMIVAQVGSMGKAAQRLNTTQPAVSRTIADLEDAIGVRLLDRSQKGVEPTPRGRALLHCAAAVFDDLRQGVKNIEFLSDPTIGDIKVGANEAFIAGLLSTVLVTLRQRYPGIAIHMTNVASLADQYRQLRERKVDLVLGRIASKIELENDIETQTVYHDRMVVVGRVQKRWSTRRKLDLAALANEPWGLPPLDTAYGSLVQDVFRRRGIAIRAAATGSPHLLLSLLAKGLFLVTIPDSVLKLSTNLPPFKIVPVELPVPPWPVGIMTLKNRTISPVAQLFVDTAREIGQSLNCPPLR
jgi:DNA-binding transcriptional LysR family regulator